MSAHPGTDPIDLPKISSKTSANNLICLDKGSTDDLNFYLYLKLIK